MKTLLQRNESEKFVFILQGVHNIFCKSDMFNISAYTSGLFKENKITVEAFACDIDFQRLTKICQIIFEFYHIALNRHWHTHFYNPQGS